MPRFGVPVRKDGTNMAKGRFFSRRTLRSATGTAQRAVPTLIVCERHNPSKPVRLSVVPWFEFQICRRSASCPGSRRVLRGEPFTARSHFQQQSNEGTKRNSGFITLFLCCSTRCIASRGSSRYKLKPLKTPGSS